MSTSRKIDLGHSQELRLLVSREDQRSPLEQGLLDTVDDSVDESESRHMTIFLMPPEDQQVDRRSPEEEGLLDIDMVYELESKHTIFLSHSGAQKNFVEQLCEDLERARLSPFFDKRPESLPKGEEFALHIFRAAEQIELAVVVVSEEYFTRSPWPMLELCAFVQSSKCKAILPLFFALKFEEFRNQERRERWFETWQAWARDDARIRIEDWKNALRVLDRRNGLHYVEALGEVDFRKDVVRTVSDITKKALHRLSTHEKSQKGWLEIILWVILIIIIGIIIYVVCSILNMVFIYKIQFSFSKDLIKQMMKESFEEGQKLMEDSKFLTRLQSMTST